MRFGVFTVVFTVDPPRSWKTFGRSTALHSGDRDFFSDPVQVMITFNYELIVDKGSVSLFNIH